MQQAGIDPVCCIIFFYKDVKKEFGITNKRGKAVYMRC